MREVSGMEGIFEDGGKFYTLSSAPGTRIYSEKLVTVGEKEYREWNPNRSKLAAYLMNGGKEIPIGKESKILYLGASSGTTASHIQDIASAGTVYCIEFAQRMFRELVVNCECRKNMMPIMGDATKPSDYRFAVFGQDVVYQDVAQKNQVNILANNMKEYGAKYGMLALKARSEDVQQSPEKIFESTKKKLKEKNLSIIDCRTLEPYEDSHCMFVVKS